MATGGDVQPQGRFPPHGTICEILQLDGVHVFATPGFCHRASGGIFGLVTCLRIHGPPGFLCASVYGILTGEEITFAYMRWHVPCLYGNSTRPWGRSPGVFFCIVFLCPC